MRRGCGCLFVLVLLVVIATLLVIGAMRGPQLTPVPTSHQQAVSAQAKLTDMTGAVNRAKQSGQPVPFTETFTDGELSSLVNEHVAGAGAPIDSVILHSNPAGYIEGQASAHIAGQTVPVYLRANVDVSNGRATLRLAQSKLGLVPIPGSVSDQIDAALKQAVNLGNQAPVDKLEVKVGNGTLTISGVAKPVA